MDKMDLEQIERQIGYFDQIENPRLTIRRDTAKELIARIRDLERENAALVKDYDARIAAKGVLLKEVREALVRRTPKGCICDMCAGTRPLLAKLDEALLTFWGMAYRDVASVHHEVPLSKAQK